jgi:CRISPR/Cas system CMR-associated protein Cmr5 small subunit
MEKIYISIDPGCDSFKVVINKTMFNIPSNVEEVVLKDIRNLVSASSPEKHLICHKNGESYAIGELAKTHMASSRTIGNYYGGIRDNQNRKINDGQEYFLSNEFQVGIESMIGYGIYGYSLDNNISIDELLKREIICSVTLPHGAVDEYSEPVISKVSGLHTYKMTIGQGNEIKFSYNIERTNVLIMSQVIAAIMGELLDDNGQPLDKVTINQFPTIVLDGGYRTMGIVNVRDDFFIDEREAESNEDFAMVNVNNHVSKIIKERFNVDMPEYLVEQNMNKKEFEQSYRDKENNNKFSKFNLKELKDYETDRVVRDMVEYLDKKFDDLRENKGILITGGTGAAYYNPLKTIYIDERSQFTKDQIILTNAPFNGKPCEPVFAIAVGSYKAMMAQE